MEIAIGMAGVAIALAAFLWPKWAESRRAQLFSELREFRDQRQAMQRPGMSGVKAAADYIELYADDIEAEEPTFRLARLVWDKKLRHKLMASSSISEECRVLLTWADAVDSKRTKR